MTRLADTHVPEADWREASAYLTPAELGALVALVIVINAWNAVGVTTRAWTPALWTQHRPSGDHPTKGPPTMDQTELTRTAVTTYFEAWRTRDFDRLRTVLAPDVAFVGVLGTANGIDECIAGLRGMAESIMTDLVLHARVVEEQDAITWFDLLTATTPPIPTANWSHAEDGRITRIRVTFDPRPLTGPSAGSA